MTQGVFASYMGVSKKTVEAWECGRTHPTGPAFRLLDILASEDLDETEFVVANDNKNKKGFPSALLLWKYNALRFPGEQQVGEALFIFAKITFVYNRIQIGYNCHV